MLLKSLLALSTASLAAAKLVEVWYNISYVQANPDGLFERQAVGVNGTWPPPVLSVTRNDTVRVHAYNGLDVPTALHHHGLFFNATGYYDGAPGVTQCGIPPGQSLTYELDVAEQWGTYWWHSHVGGQYVDGLRSAFVINNPVEQHTYDDEYIIILGDWYHEQHKVLSKKFLGIYNPTGAEPVPESALIYAAHNNGTYLPGFNQNLSIPFEAGKTYRLRFINSGSFAMYHVYLDGHDMRVIEADGTDTEEYPVDFLGITVAQRYSVLVTAKNETNMNYNLHVNFDYTMFDSYTEDQALNFTSIISYGAGNPIAPDDLVDTMVRTTDELLVPSIPEPQLVADRFIELGIFFDTFDNGGNRAAFNNITYSLPQVPSLFTELSMGADASNVNIYGPQTHVYVLEAGEVVDLQLINWDANAHPFHLHGHKYQMVRTALDVASDDPELNPPHTEGAANPMRRDTVSVPAGGAVNLRFVADNPGAWIFHCHIEWHLEAGLAMVFIEAPTLAQERMSIPQEMKDQCASLNIPYTGNAVGKNSTTDLAGVIRGPYPQVLGWRPKGIGALAGTVLAALFGMLCVVWYALGGQLDEDEVEDEVRRELEQKKEGGLLKRSFKKAVASAKK